MPYNPNQAHDPPVVRPSRATRYMVPRDHTLHVTDAPSEIAPTLRCLGLPPTLNSVEPQPTSVLAHGGARWAWRRGAGAVERALWTGLAALSSQGCMRGAPVRWGEGQGPCVGNARPCVLRAVSNAVVLRGGDRAVWPMGATTLPGQRADVRAAATLSRTAVCGLRPHRTIPNRYCTVHHHLSTILYHTLPATPYAPAPAPRSSFTCSSHVHAGARRCACVSARRWTF